ncbi:MAG: glycoside hydrolase family 36 protein [Terriglobia bacterium]|jgi:alpha-galactosidase
MNTNRKRSHAFLNTCTQLAAVLATIVLAGVCFGWPAYAGTPQATTKANAAGKATRRIPAAPNPADMLQSRAWAKQFFSRPAALPISFVLDGKPIRGIPPTWRPEASRRVIDNTRVETDFEGTDPKTRLRVRVECTEFRDFPVTEWVAWFSNEGREPTPIIRDVLALDGEFQGSNALLYSNNGDFYSETGYTPTVKSLDKGASLSFAPNGGRPSDGAFPYYRIMFDKWGLSLAIGWPGEWAIHFDGVPDGVQVRAGQQKTNLRLMPGERIRTPRMTVLTWSGDASRAVNLWRRWYLAHILPRPSGEPLKPLLAVAATDEGEEFTRATQENQLRYMEKFKRLGFNFDIWWIDAGWYPCGGHWPNTGTWEPDPERFPHGFKPVSDLASKNGARLLVWFEPERVRQGTELSREHPEWLLTLEGNENSLLNLGNPECRAWLTEHVCRLIKENGIKVYRQDFNFEPLEYWRKNEAEDRQGINENLHVQGYLRYWDDLLARNPGLWIDSCSSGGRRNDLETMRRAVPLHYSDYGYGYHAIKLSFHQTLFEWLPYFKDVTLSWDIDKPGRFDKQVDSYAYHCAMAPMLALGLDIKRDDYDFAASQKMIAVWRRAAGLILYGDYYPHTPFRRSPDQWVAWQFDSPEKGQGFVQAIRLPAAREATLTIHPKGLDSSVTYVFENSESGETREITGRDLLAGGFTFSLPARSGAIWFYRRAGN